jgi:alanyl-tRNA synthetase
MEEQRERARSAEKTTSTAVHIAADVDLPHTNDSFKYTETTRLSAKLLGWLVDGQWINQGSLSEGTAADLVLDRTCFYGESGGQVGDTGVVNCGSSMFVVEDTHKVNGNAIIHRGKVVRGVFKVGDAVELELNADRRRDIANNHTATHLLQWALRQVLGDHVKQAGSLVCDEYLRFDFTHTKAMTPDEIKRVEELVREKIDAAAPAVTQEMPLDKALKMGVTALFGEKYGQTVRVMAIGIDKPEDLKKAFSAELCGGTHIKNTASIMDFKIVREESLQTGVRRITAKTGRALRDLLHERYDLFNDLCHALKVPAEQVPARIISLLDENKKLKKQAQSAPAADLSSTTQKMFDDAPRLGGACVVVAEMPNAPADKIRTQIDWIKQKAGSAVVVFGSRSEDKVQLLAAVTDDLVKKGLSAGKIIGQIAKIVGGGGGGRDQMAQAGGKDPDKLPEALAEAEKLIREKLS